MFKDKAGNFSPFRLVGLILVVVFAVIFLSSSFVVIPAGHTGVALTFGKVEDNVLQEGLHFKVPFVQKIERACASPTWGWCSPPITRPIWKTRRSIASS